MNVLGQLRIIGLLSQDRVVRHMAAHDPDGRPVLLTVGQAALHQGEPEAYAAWAQRLTTCSSHPHIAEVFTYGVADGRAYLAVRTGERRTLAESLAQRGPMPYEHVRAVGIALADALAAAHEVGLFHLAVRPEAIFLDDEQGPVLVGFDTAAPGLVRPMATGPLAAPEYRAPRAVLDGKGPVIGAPADVYALAATLYQALGGRLPWLAPGADPADPALRSAPLPDLPEIPPTLVETLRRAATPQPLERLTAAQLRDALMSLTPESRRLGPDEEPPLPDAALGAVASLSMLSAQSLPPVGGVETASAEPPAQSPPHGPTPVEGDESLRPLIGMWRIATGGGDQELLVVNPDGTVTWTGGDDEGPFIASGEALPVGEGTYRLLLNEPAGGAGFYVDLTLENGGVSFVMPDGPESGMVDVPSGAE